MCAEFLLQVVVGRTFRVVCKEPLTISPYPFTTYELHWVCYNRPAQQKIAIMDRV